MNFTILFGTDIQKKTPVNRCFCLLFSLMSGMIIFTWLNNENSVLNLFPGPRQVASVSYLYLELTFTCSKSTTETLEKGVKHVQR